MPNNKVHGSFSQALFFSGSVSIPRFLLDHYNELGVSDREMMLIIHLLTENSEINNINDLEKRIIKKMGLAESEFNNLILGLKNKGMLAINPGLKSQNEFYYDIRGLIDQLFEIWGINQYKQIEKTVSPSSTKLTSVFEKELGRPLTGFECEHIQKWLLAYNEELVIEALRRGVSAGIRNFRYLDSILREWEKKGIKTSLEVEAEDENFQARQTKKGERQRKSKAVPNSKYDDIYL